ncbi:DUF5034 domain-containing protein [Gilvimarinus agarilyticus]|uniref:DUF5034 domain-containing protein n=1 Tax=unclassified Gilvimarinus TaxID=2642066 RepID=UPI001C09A7C8|nr:MULTISPECIES: DUF5034 domain-containing protein [unclassified Gilvimarinus]MBU2886878.1 DUF5034 domain-containing protein [Gilvimarinus agarilyticus]MDO6571539.1 DUF5034 domain-containing protein [Gilvimarinus sp. 2_MG-2023]MDO6747938.1 DUF5034 domain-containing protein [Gilvimarinus sp. 1_MG-2023]
MKAPLLTSCASFTAILLSACGGSGTDPCGGSLPPPSEYTVNDYQVSVIQHAEPITANTYDYGEPVNGEPVSWSQLGVVLTADVQHYQVQAAPTRWSLWPLALACSPAPSQPAQTVVSISVVSDNAYTDDYPAGSDLSGIVAPYGMLVWVDAEDLNDYFVQQPGAPERLSLFFTEPPQYARHTFTITVELDDGSRFVLDSPDVEMQFGSVSASVLPQ